MVTSRKELAARTQGTSLNENTVCLDLGVGTPLYTFVKNYAFNKTMHLIYTLKTINKCEGKKHWSFTGHFLNERWYL